MATAYESAGPLPLAASFGQRVYYAYPVSRQAVDAAQLLARMRDRLGPDYPPPLPGAMLGRAGKWLEARDYRRARTEYEALIPQLGGAERELAQVRSGAALYLAGNARQADAYLRTLVLNAPDTDAERLYYLVRCERTLEDLEGMLDFLDRLKVQYPDSQWRLSALIWAGNYYLLKNDRASYLPLYRACYEAFPGDPSAAYCHWKVAWTAYLEKRAEAGQLLSEHLTLFPQSDKCPAALYFLGRLAEAASGKAGARASYRKILEAYPNNYYAALAAERLKPETIAPAAPASVDFAPSAASTRRISRARLLASAGLSDWANQELLFSAKEDGQPQAIAVELARQASSRGAPEEAIRSYQGSCSQLPRDAAGPCVARDVAPGFSAALPPADRDVRQGAGARSLPAGGLDPAGIRVRRGRRLPGGGVRPDAGDARNRPGTQPELSNSAGLERACSATPATTSVWEPSTSDPCSTLWQDPPKRPWLPTTAARPEWTIG